MTAKQAREFCANFRVLGQGQVTFVETTDGRIDFDTMTDEQAIDVAIMLADLQAEIERKQGNAQ